MELMKVNGTGLEVQRLPAAAGTRRAPIVFLHEGLGSVAMWREWPAQVCDDAGRTGVVYSRRGYGQSESIDRPALTLRIRVSLDVCEQIEQDLRQDASIADP